MTNEDRALTPDERKALGKFQRDYQSAVPMMTQLAQTAKALHQAMIDAPIWHIQEGTPEAGATVPDEPQEWSVGHAQVNYVDHIEHEGAQDK